MCDLRIENGDNISQHMPWRAEHGDIGTTSFVCCRFGSHGGVHSNQSCFPRQAGMEAGRTKMVAPILISLAFHVYSSARSCFSQGFDSHGGRLYAIRIKMAEVEHSNAKGFFW